MAFERGVVGLGRSGLAVLEQSLWEGLAPERILAWVDQEPGTEQVETLRHLGVRLVWGREAFLHLQDCSELVVSPGVNARAERFEPLRQAGIPILSELEWAWRRLGGNPVVAVTGANGKSTTVSLIHHLLSRAGRSSVLAGNIGLPLASVLKDLDPGTVLVLEVSSFQLEESQTFRPHVGILTNITPDHLDRHGEMDRYGRIKMSLFARQEENDFALLNARDPWSRRIPVPGRGRRIWIGDEAGLPVSWTAEELVMREPLRPGRVGLAVNPLPGPHNLENGAAALAAAHILGLGDEVLGHHWATFQGLAHRMETVAECQRIRFVNDSKATNVDATLRALQAQKDSVVLILGGRDKAGEFGLLRDEIRRCCVRVLLIGESAETIQAWLGRDIPSEMVGDMARAVSSAGAILDGRGGVVLLAPACASFDQYRNFEDRGADFTRLARGWCAGGGQE